MYGLPSAPARNLDQIQRCCSIPFLIHTIKYSSWNCRLLYFISLLIFLYNNATMIHAHSKEPAYVNREQDWRAWLIITYTMIPHSTTFRALWSLILYSLVITYSSNSPPPVTISHETVVFQRGEGGYYCIKIPSLLTTAKGTLIAFGEGRMFSCSDFTWTDLIYKRSTDDGKTWGPLQILYSNSSKVDGQHTVIGNAAPVVLRDSHRILLPFCRNNLQVILTYSDDDGIMWSPPVNISGVVHPSWSWVATGPPGSIQLESKRIVVPSYHSFKPLPLDGEVSEAHMMLSDDGGMSWYIGGTIADWVLQFPNENQAVSLGGDRIFVNARTLLSDRMAAYSSDGGITFGDHFIPKGLSQPLMGCEGSTIRQPETGILYYSGPHIPFPTSLRYNMSIFTSVDNGTTWTAQMVIHPGASAYSSLSILSDGHSVGLLYEWANETKVIFDPDYFTFVVIN